MAKIKVAISLEEMREFFLTAMFNGWAGNGEKQSIPALPGHKAIEFREGALRLLDCYSKTPDSNKSSGTTTIFHKDAPVWIMQYSGWYEIEAIPFLKNVLVDTYRKKEFFGGRGHELYDGDDLVYMNTCLENNFSRFHGREQIILTDPDKHLGFGKIKNLGFHNYSGMSLI